jgi:hypothetical protein
LIVILSWAAVYPLFRDEKSVWNAWEAVGFLIKANRAEESEKRPSVFRIWTMAEKFERQIARVLPQVAVWFSDVGVSVFESIVWALKVWGI